MDLELVSFLFMTTGYILMSAGGYIRKGQRLHPEHHNRKEKYLWHANSFIPFWSGFFLVMVGSFIYMYLRGWL